MNLPSSLVKSFDTRQIDLFQKKKTSEEKGGPGVPEALQDDDEPNRGAAAKEENTSNKGINSVPTSRICRWSQHTVTILKRHCAFIGPGIVASVGYTDPGNWVTDLAAGSQFGYALLFTVLLSGLFGIFLQILAVRMGVVTGEDLARNTRLLCLPEGRNGEVVEGLRWRKTRIGVLWFAYLVSEGALIATELAELIGSAIALNLLFPSLPVWGGVLVTSADVFIILLVYKPNGNFRILEWVISGLVLAVIACYIALLVRVKPDWADVFHGFVPSSTLIQHEALYASIGILGAVIMPHSLFLGSNFATINRLPAAASSHIAARNNVEDGSSTSIATAAAAAAAASPPAPNPQHTWIRMVKKVASMLDSDLVENSDAPSTRIPTSKLTIAEMKIQIPHASWDIALSLIFFAITVNSAILIVAAAAFYYQQGTTSLSDLYDAFHLLQATLGKVYAVLFAVALLAAGQSASITVTLAGQLVSEGFIKWKTNAFVRRMVTRLITIAPSIAIAVAVGRNGLDQTLIASQVALSFALPVVLVPLILVTSLASKMKVEEEVDSEAADSTKTTTRVQDSTTTTATTATPIADTTATTDPFLTHNFTNPRYIIALAILIYTAIVLADIYTLVTVIKG